MARLVLGAFGVLLIPQGFGILGAVFPREQIGQLRRVEKHLPVGGVGTRHVEREVVGIGREALGERDEIGRGIGGSNAAGLTSIDPAAVTAAAKYDYVIVYAGTDRSVAGEFQDRPGGRWVCGRSSWYRQHWCEHQAQTQESTR